jgi:nickel-dependent lactate racemase
MPVYPFPYGRSVQNVSIDLPHVDVYAAHPTYPPVTDATGEIQRCIAESVDGSTFEQFRGIQTAAIAINDKTRPTPLKTIIPVIVGQLREIGVRQENIPLLIAVGPHSPAPQDEFDLLKADLGLSVQIFSHDCDLTEQLI